MWLSIHDLRPISKYEMRKQTFILAVCALILGAIAPVRNTFGQSSAWQLPVQLSETGRFSWFPDIAADASGRVHVVWSSGQGRYDTVMYATGPHADSAPSFSRPTDIAAFLQPNVGESAATRPAVIVDMSGTLQLTATDYFQIYLSQAPYDNAQRPQSWTDPAILSTETSTYFSKMAVDSHGALHVVFTQNVSSPECLICFHLFYRTSNDGGKSWSSLTDISNLETGSAKPQIIVDREDNLHVVWESGYGGTLGGVNSPTRALYSASYDGGKTWASPFEFTTDNANSEARSVAIAADGEGKLITVWLGLPENAIYFQVSRDKGQSWSAPQRLPQVASTRPIYTAPLDTYAMATDGGGNVHLVLAGRLDNDQQQLSLLHLVWNGSSWSDPQTIASYPSGDSPEWPRIAVGLGNELHVTWFTRDRESLFASNSVNADYRVWYAYASADAPAAQPVSYPTPTPQVVGTSAAESSRIEATPVAVTSLVPSTSNATLRSELDEVALLLISALPVIGIVLAVLLIFRARR